MTDERDERFDVGRFVGAKIHRLLGSQPGNLPPSSRALLAQLRQASSAEPGTAPAIWTLTAEGLPDGLRGEMRWRHEAAIHVALTQFATHQQARATAMHSPKQRFATAVRRLAETQTGHDQDPHQTPVYSRFSAMLNTTTLAGLLAHSRGIITQLRSAELAFDYAAYARDIYWFLTPGAANDVRRRWGQDFHRSPLADATTHTTTEGVSE